MGGILYDVEDRHVRTIISDAYDPEKIYAAGDYCIRDNTLYKCTEETTDVWNSTSWEATNVGNEFVGVTNSLNAIGAMQTTNNDESFACASNTTTRFCPLTLTKGVYVLIVNTAISNVTKEGDVTVSIANASYSGRQGARMVVGKNSYLSTLGFVYVPDTKNVEIAVWQNSGAEITAVTNKLMALKIK